MLFDSSATDEERKAAAPYFYPREKDGIVFFPTGYGSSEQHSPNLFIISQYVQWNMIIFEGFAEELGFDGIYLQHNWDDLSKEETEEMCIRDRHQISRLPARQCCERRRITR